MSRLENVLAYFRSRPNTWVSALDLMSVGGALSWRSRVADARTQLGTLVNRQRRVVRSDGTSITVSEYMFVEHVVMKDAPPRKSEQEDATNVGLPL